jgi:competence CoiA-like predicted nuclease
VSTEDGMLTWYKVEQPYADQNGQVDATFFYKIESQIEYEYNFYEQRAKVVPQDQAEHLTAPIAYLKYSRNHQTLVFGT